MDLTVSFRFLLPLVLVATLVDTSAGQPGAQLSNNFPSPPPIPGNFSVGDVSDAMKKARNKAAGSFMNKRPKRAAAPPPPPTMEDAFKDFSSKLGKTPDEMRAAFGKFLESHGVTIQQVQEHLKTGHQAVMQMVESIKRAMQS